MKNEDWLTVAEFAAASGGAERTLRRRASSGQLRAELRQDGRGRPKWHIHRDELRNSRFAATARQEMAALHPPANDAALAGQLAEMQKQIGELRGFLAGQAATEQNLENRVSKAVADAIKPLLLELQAQSAEIERLKKEAEEKVRQNSGVLFRIFGRK
jgi:hypothetical protein